MRICITNKETKEKTRKEKEEEEDDDNQTSWQTLDILNITFIIFFNLDGSLLLIKNRGHV